MLLLRATGIECSTWGRRSQIKLIGVFSRLRADLGVGLRARGPPYWAHFGCANVSE